MTMTTNEVIDLIFGKLDEDGALFNEMMHTMTDIDAHGWGESPTMMVDLRVPHIVREFLDGVEMPYNVTRGQFESALFTFLVIHGISHVLRNNKPSINEILGGILDGRIGAEVIPIDRGSPLGDTIGKILKEAAADGRAVTEDCETCEKADDCPIKKAKEESGDVIGSC